MQLPKNAEIISEFVVSLEDELVPPETNEQRISDLTIEQKSAWVPALNPTQLDIYHNVDARYILAHGERGSGKSIAMLHKIVKHCYEEFNALACIIVGIKRTAIEGGAWHKLVYDVLPQWKQGIGLMYTESKLVASTKDDYLFIQNKFGGWSRVLLVSMPVEQFVRERVRGLEMSLVFCDELTTLASDIYFSAVIQQLGRRPHISGPQQYLAATNPEGPSHWVYKRFFIKPRDKETGIWNKKYAVYHVPLKENEKNLPQGYYSQVEEATSNDDIERRRLLLGEWVDRPSGDSIFKGYFDERIHMRGDEEKDLRIIPKAGFDLVLGYDLGTANSSITFLQNIPTMEKDLWLCFDEMHFHEAYIPYLTLVPAIMRRLSFWNKRVGTPFNVVHVSDASAFNQFRAADGSYDSLEVERLSTIAHKDFPDVKPIQMIAAPRYNGSVMGRVKTVMKYLQQERLLISASCVKTKQMFMHLESEKLKDGKYMPDLPFQPKRSKHIHVFDSLSYPLFFYEIGQGALNKQTTFDPPELMPIGIQKGY